MCVNYKEAYLCKNPKHIFGNWILKTRQYNEYVQYDKEYILFPNNACIGRFRSVQRIYLPCGKCFTCLAKRAKSWTFRLSTEYMKYKDNVVLTLTYDDEHLPENGLIYYRDVQLFLKRLRKKYPGKKIRFACCCEYGSKNTIRPHYHIILFNFFPDDVDLCKPYKITEKGSKLYKSQICNDLWSNGFVDVGLVDFHTARYVCQYCSKKALHKNNPVYQEKISQSREKLICSIGTGLEFFHKNYKSIFHYMYCQLKKLKYPIPKYFKNKLKEYYPDEFLKYKDKCKELLSNFVLDEETRNRLQAVENRLRNLYIKFHT